VLTFTGTHDQKKNKYLRNIRLKPDQKKLILPEHDIIEANSDGVRTTNLENYLNGYTNRMIIFRPSLIDDDISTVMNNLHSYLGVAYDFDFDLENGEKQTCIEIIYRSYNGIGNIKLDLEEIFGTTTLTGDNLLEYFIKDDKTKLVLLAVENENKPGRAEFLTDEDAISYLKQNAPEEINTSN
jgi:hypothetical protein